MMSELDSLCILSLYSLDNKIVIDTMPPEELDQTDWGVIFTLDLASLSSADHYNTRDTSYNYILGSIFSLESNLEYYLPGFIRNMESYLDDITEPWLTEKNLDAMARFYFHKKMRWEETPTHYILTMNGDRIRSTLYTPYLPVGSKVPKVLFEEHITTLARVLILLSCPSTIKGIYWGPATSNLGTGLYKARSFILDWFSIEVPKVGFLQLPYPSIKALSVDALGIYTAVYTYKAPYFITGFLKLIYMLEKTRFCLLGIKTDVTKVQGASTEDLAKLQKTTGTLGKKTVRLKNKPHALPSQDLYSLGLVLCLLDGRVEEGTDVLSFYYSNCFNASNGSSTKYYSPKDAYSNFCSQLSENPQRVMNTVQAFDQVKKDVSPWVTFIPNLLKRWALILFKRSSNITLPGSKAFPRISFESRGFYKIAKCSKELDFSDIYLSLNRLANILYIKHYSDTITDLLDYNGNGFCGYSYLAKTMFVGPLEAAVSKESTSFIHTSIKDSFKKCIFKTDNGPFYTISTKFDNGLNNQNIKLLGKIIAGCDTFTGEKYSNLVYTQKEGTTDLLQNLDLSFIYKEYLLNYVREFLKVDKIYDLVSFSYDQLKVSRSSYNDSYCNYLRNRACYPTDEPCSLSLRFISLNSICLQDIYDIWEKRRYHPNPLVLTELSRLLQHVLPKIRTLLKAHLIEWDFYMSLLIQETLLFVDHWIIEIQGLNLDNK